MDAEGRTLPVLAGAVLALLLAGCTVGPDFRQPVPPAVAGYAPGPLPNATADAAAASGGAQRFRVGQDIPAQWWTLFRSPALNALVARALRDNPDLEAAQAALRAAREVVHAQAGASFPTVQAGLTPQRQKNALGNLAPALSSGDAIYNLYTAQVSVSYLPDVFGGNRRQVESLKAQAEFQSFQLQAARLALTANVVAAAITEASLRAQLAGSRQSLALQREALELYRRQLEFGAISGADLLAQEASVAQSEAGIPGLEKQLAQTRNLLSALCGSLSAQEVPERFELEELDLPLELPLTLPAKLVRQRPDVRAAEASLHAATAQVGVALSNLLPQINLSAALGTTGTQVNQLFTPFNAFWSIGASLSQTLFDAGVLRHRRRAADALLDQAGAQYRSSVVYAVQNVADVLRALHYDALALKATVDLEAAARRSLDSAREALGLGAVSHLAVLGAQQTHQQALIALAQARAARYSDTAALFQALGGGWWNSPGAEPVSLR